MALATPNTHEVKSTCVEPLTDTETQISDLVYPFPLSYLRYEMLANHVRNEDPFRVVNSGLYYQITRSVHHLSEFLTWLSDSYQKEKNRFVSTSGVVILKITPSLNPKSSKFP